MKRFPPLEVSYIIKRLRVDLEAGRVYWLDATKHHKNLVGKEAGNPRKGSRNKHYWIVKIDGVPYKRAQIILAVATGKWPSDMVDHKNGNSLDDRATNIRHANKFQNAWNHKGRKKTLNLPMGVRKTSNGRFMARIGVNKKMKHLGTFGTPDEASNIYQRARAQYFGEFA